MILWLQHTRKNKRPVNFYAPAFPYFEDVILFFIMPAHRFASIIYQIERVKL